MWNPQDFSLLVHAFAVRKRRPWFDRLLSTVVLWLLARKLLRWKLIPTPEQDAYMLRVYLSPGGTAKNPHKFAALFLHYIFCADYDRGVHSHPYPWFYSLLLTGGYDETNTQDGKHCTSTTYEAGDVNHVTAKEFHRVSRLHGEGVWSLFFCGPRHKEEPGWGFIDFETGYRDARPDKAEGVSGDWYNGQ